MNIHKIMPAQIKRPGKRGEQYKKAQYCKAANDSGVLLFTNFVQYIMIVVHEILQQCQVSV